MPPKRQRPPPPPPAEPAPPAPADEPVFPPPKPPDARPRLSDDKPVCKFGAACKFTNPAHFQRYHHPAASAPAPPQAAVDAAQETSQLSLSEAVASEEKTTKVTTLEAYKQLLVVALQDNRISADEKRLVRRFRQHWGSPSTSTRSSSGRSGGARRTTRTGSSA